MSMFNYLISQSPRKLIFALIKFAATAFTEMGAERFVQIATEQEFPVELEDLLRQVSGSTETVIDDDFWEAVDAVRADPDGLDAEAGSSTPAAP